MSKPSKLRFFNPIRPLLPAQTPKSIGNKEKKITKSFQKPLKRTPRSSFLHASPPPPPSLYLTPLAITDDPAEKSTGPPPSSPLLFSETPFQFFSPASYPPSTENKEVDFGFLYPRTKARRSARESPISDLQTRGFTPLLRRHSHRVIYTNEVTKLPRQLSNTFQNATPPQIPSPPETLAFN